MQKRKLPFYSLFAQIKPLIISMLLLLMFSKYLPLLIVPCKAPSFDILFALSLSV